jgi:phosphoribosyl-ATP pyrophosphohydrolase/phosphoribosyl-AMP cyclohydrolase
MAVAVPDQLKYDANGLIPVIVQDRLSGDVLMLAFANEEAVRLTGETATAHFWSRSRGKLWKKGETSGNVLRVREVRTDCDRDCLLVVAEPAGPTCHTNVRTCFGEDTATSAGILHEVERVIQARALERPAGSYTASLIDKGLDHTLKKIGEETTELILAAKGADDEHVVDEAADLLYHLSVALHQRGLSLSRVLDALRARREKRT